MSTKKKVLSPKGLPRAASKRRKEREARDALPPAPPPKPLPPPEPPKPAPPPPPGLKRPDLLEDFIKSETKVAAVKASAPAPCQHKHLAFTNMGAMLNCIDCKRRYHIVMPSGTVPDVGYFNASITDLETRHTPYETPRITPNS
jgi:hypothetical protein